MFCSHCGASLPEGATFCPRCGTPVTRPAGETASVSVPYSPAPASEPLPATPRYGGFWRRGWALVLDNFIIGVVTMPLAFALGIPMLFLGFARERDMSPEAFGAFMATALLVGVCGMILNWLYFALFESSARQASLGKMALGLRVTDLDGRRLSFARASGRYFATLLSKLVLGIGFLMIAFTEKKQGLHDMLAGTLVVRT
jgi:uncharacterized RDD family membrane protein YckC